ncbi:uncharacterized protein LOC125817297 [Solanum verrucosum]|uniref:uncharacterized protein LOC125817297 n=1 Tax=Solanum verrucosum TaxID=315347 RepID=UPI0020D15DD6|nr:uncharacterized protein LOC125817297 [Solanum verrucosum]
MHVSYYLRWKQTIDSPIPIEVESLKELEEAEVEELEQPKDQVDKEEELPKRGPSVFEGNDNDKLQHYSVIATRSLVQKKKDPGLFTIPCTIGALHFSKALRDLGSNINLMSLFVFKKFGLGAPESTSIRLLMADHIVKKPVGVLQDVLVKLEAFIFLVDFVILEYEVDFKCLSS